MAVLELASLPSCHHSGEDEMGHHHDKPGTWAVPGRVGGAGSCTDFILHVGPTESKGHSVKPSVFLAPLPQEEEEDVLK